MLMKMRKRSTLGNVRVSNGSLMKTLGQMVFLREKEGVNKLIAMLRSKVGRIY